MENWHITGASIVAFAGMLFAIDRIWRILLKPIVEFKRETEDWRERQGLRNKAYDRNLPDDARAILYDNLNREEIT